MWVWRDSPPRCLLGVAFALRIGDNHRPILDVQTTEKLNQGAFVLGGGVSFYGGRLCGIESGVESGVAGSFLVLCQIGGGDSGAFIQLTAQLCEGCFQFIRGGVFEVILIQFLNLCITMAFFAVFLVFFFMVFPP